MQSTTLFWYSDADHASDGDGRRSRTGYVFMLNGGAVSWRSQKQQSVALSTAEAEYMALAAALPMPPAAPVITTVFILANFKLHNCSGKWWQFYLG